ncbi:retrovirus-related pol polyprotein from transposon TNT 1-94 [Tanacetum coccineum]|uniref:Retrovirus-related pol polyprotein from transposon TNT 1-94 n=1 Tax=Tanacetum coccineum TaxID=301880 RepID=A0ABQ5B8Z8_9ASTR
MAFLTAVASSRFPSTNNQLRTSSNLRNQSHYFQKRQGLHATKFSGDKGKNYSGLLIKGNAIQPKRPRNAAWYKEKAMLDEAQEAGQILNEEQLALLADPGILASQEQTIIPHNAAFQTEDLDTYDYDCDDISTAQAVLMANISNYGSGVISKVPNSASNLNDMDNQSVHALQNFEQSPVVDFLDNEITSDSNIIPYSQYLEETQQATVQDTNLQAQQDSMILSVIEQMSEQMINHVNNWEKANKEQNNESITAELERFKEQASWLRISIPTIESSYTPPVRVKVPREQPKASLVNESLKKLKFQLVQFDYVVKKRTTPDVLTEVEQAKAKQPLDNVLDFACKHAKRIQELLVYVRDTCPSAIKLSKTKVAITPMNKIKKVTFTEPITSSSTNQETHDSNKPLLHSTGVKCSTSASGSKPSGNTKNNRISQPSSSNKINKVEDQPRSVKSRKNKKNRVNKAKCNDNVMQSMSNANSISVSISNAPVKNSVNDVKSGCLCAIYGKCMIAETHDELSRLYSDSRTTRLQGLWGYGDYQLGNVIISRVYYVEGLGHNLFSIGQFCDADLEVAFRKNTFFIRNLEGVDLLLGSRDTNLYTFSLDDMLKSSPICLLSKASKTKSWLWHRRLSHLNFGTLNKLAKNGLARGIPRLKFQKDHLCLACALGKSKKTSHQPKAEYTNQEKLYLLHMDLCGPMRVASINGKRYILVIVDDYSRFTWVRFLKTKDEAPTAIIKCIKNIQVRLKSTVRNVRTDNGTEFVNQTLREWYENVSISYQTFVARTPQQNGLVERRNRTPVEAARTMLIFSKATLFLWAEAINTTCYTQNRSLIRLRYNKTPYELMQDKKTDLSFFHVFGSLCYPTNNHEDLGKFNTKADIGIFVGYAPAKKAFIIYNRRTRVITETIHVTFDELSAMASE